MKLNKKMRTNKKSGNKKQKRREYKDLEPEKTLDVFQVF